MLGLTLGGVIVGIRTGRIPWILPEPSAQIPCSSVTITGIELLSADGRPLEAIPPGGVLTAGALYHPLRPKADPTAVELGCPYEWILLSQDFDFRFVGTEFRLDRWVFAGAETVDALALVVRSIDQQGNVAGNPVSFQFDPTSP
jgi:hypothetical protein